MNPKTPKIKEVVTKIDDKIAKYSEEYPKSKALRQIIRYKERVLNSKNDEEIFKLGVNLAYNLDTICDDEKTGYVKDEREKKHWLEISEELFKNTIGAKK